MRYFIIVNPISGRGLGEKSIPTIEAQMQAHKLEYKLVRSERIWHAADLAEQAARERYDAVVCASGDGTVNEAINGIMRARKDGFDTTAFSVISIGTGNDFAGGVGMATDWREGVPMLAANKRRRIDLGFVKGGDFPEGRYFGNGIGIGFDAAVGDEAIKIRWTRGIIAYLIGVIKTVFLYYNPPRARITLDEREVIEQVSLMVSIMNGKRMGGGFKMTPDSRPDDGLFDLCIAATGTKWRILQLIPHFLKGTQATQPEIQMRRARKATVESLDVPFPAHADGEFICLQGKRLEVEICPRALEIICL